MHSCLPSFLPLLDRFNPDDLDRHSGAVYGLFPDFTLAACNQAWYSFARENGGEKILVEWVLGRTILTAIPPSLSDFYIRAYRECLSTGQTWDHDYECSSAELFRLFHQRVYPLGRQQGVLIVNSLRVERPHDAVSHAPQTPAFDRYADAQKMFHQCSHCRRFQCQDATDQWDWVPDWVRRPPASTSHGLCPVCFDYYYWQYKDRPPVVSGH